MRWLWVLMMKKILSTSLSLSSFPKQWTRKFPSFFLLLLHSLINKLKGKKPIRNHETNTLEPTHSSSTKTSTELHHSCTLFLGRLNCRVGAVLGYNTPSLSWINSTETCSMPRQGRLAANRAATLRCLLDWMWSGVLGWLFKCWLGLKAPSFEWCWWWCWRWW